MADYEPQVAEALRAMTERLVQEHPEAQEVIDLLQAGGISVQDAMTRLAKITTPESVESAAMDAFKSLRQESEDQAELVRTAGNAPLTVGDTDIPWMYQPPTGLARLNPLYEAAVIERVQFDGDIPEARTGALPEGHTPAVPVDTEARDPVAIGRMLDQASTEVMDEVRQLREGAVEDAAGLFESETALTTTEDDRALQAMQIVENAPEPEGYQRGRQPMLRAVSNPSGGALATLSDGERGLAAWRSISTTQGRRTALQALYKMVGDALQEAGHEVSLGGSQVLSKLGPGESVRAAAKWVTSLHGGPKSTQPMFSYIDTAGRVITKRLLEGPLPIEPLRLDIMPVNAVDHRTVGWQARLVGSSG